jgi:acetoin utilization protein AcuB
VRDITVKHDRIDPAVERPPGRPPLRVTDRMSRPAVTIAVDSTLEAAHDLMRARRIRHLPVVDAGGRLVGIVTDRDLRQALLAPSLRAQARRLAASLEGLPVERVMTRGVVTVRPETELRDAAALMHEQKIGAAPVVDEAGAVVGVLTESDVLRAFVDVAGERWMPAALRWVTLPERAHVRRHTSRFTG